MRDADVLPIPLLAAASLYEATALGVAEFKRSGFALASVGPSTKLTISLEPPATMHELTVARLSAWLDSAGKTPAGRATKVTMRQMTAQL